MARYEYPNSIKLISGKFVPDYFITVNVDGKEMKRKVYYSCLCGCYIIIKGIKYGKTDFDKE